MSRLVETEADRQGSDKAGTTGVGTTSGCREADPAMSRLLAAALTVVLAAVLAVGAALGVVALLEATPDQPNTPLITYEQAGQGS
jgi:hypothetical protein